MPDNEARGRYTGDKDLDSVLVRLESGTIPDKDLVKLVNALPEKAIRDLVHERVGFDGQIIANLKEVQFRARQLVDEAFDQSQQLDVRGNPVQSKDSLSREEALKLLDSANTKMIKHGAEILSMDRVNKIEQVMLTVVHKYLNSRQWDEFMDEMDKKLHPLEG